MGNTRSSKNIDIIHMKPSSLLGLTTTLARAERGCWEHGYEQYAMKQVFELTHNGEDYCLFSHTPNNTAGLDNVTWTVN